MASLNKTLIGLVQPRMSFAVMVARAWDGKELSDWYCEISWGNQTIKGKEAKTPQIALSNAIKEFNQTKGG